MHLFLQGNFLSMHVHCAMCMPGRRRQARWPLNFLSTSNNLIQNSDILRKTICISMISIQSLIFVPGFDSPPLHPKTPKPSINCLLFSIVFHDIFGHSSHEKSRIKFFIVYAQVINMCCTLFYTKMEESAGVSKERMPGDSDMHVC
jgi:hypothetical protein